MDTHLWIHWVHFEHAAQDERCRAPASGGKRASTRIRRGMPRSWEICCTGSSRVHARVRGAGTRHVAAAAIRRTFDIANGKEGTVVKGSASTSHVVAGLFAGIGGIERGLSRAGHRTAMLCENEPTAKAVLSARFPSVSLHDDVCTLRSLPPDVTLISAGFPCQDLSQAGTTVGIAGARSGLVGEVFRLVEKHRTPWVLLENVPFMLQLAKGEAMNVIASRFEDLGYAWAYRVVDARAFGVPQRRRRVYFLASRVEDPRAVLFADETQSIAEAVRNGHPVACGFYWTEGIRGLGWAVDAIPTLKGGSTIGIPSSPAILLPTGDVVTPDIRDAERLQGFPANWTKPAERLAKKGSRWRLVGNAVSVPAAAWVGRRLARPGVPHPFITSPLGQSKQWPCAAWNVGSGRMKVEASEWPVRKSCASLASFLRYEPALLSAKATTGFLRRTEVAKLRFPPGFLEAVRVHLEHMTCAPPNNRLARRWDPVLPPCP
jgi:DNA (cytosine-5)-methyltransferase 1